ncbi:MAG: RsmB/NOP family class I SAM-dependent RNA methyltransferase [Pseudomonadota bacterium]
MKTAARLQGAIEILQSILYDDIPPEKAVASWGRAHKFAGSSDRRAINDTLYDVLRNLGLLKYYMQGISPRLLVVGWMVFIKGQKVKDVHALFSGDKYCPQPLSKTEKQHILHPRPKPSSKHFEAICNISAELEPFFCFRDESDRESLMRSLQNRAPLDLRVNLSKISRNDALEQLKNDFPKSDFRLTSYSSLGIRCYDHISLKEYVLYKDGRIDIQDESSQIACEIAATLTPERMLDFCAGGGGKSLTVGILRQDLTDIIATDISEKRLKNIKERADRAALKIRHIAKHRLTPDNGKFDLVWIDAPCSGSGTWRRNIYERFATKPDDVKSYAQKQYDILCEASAFNTQKGYVIYSTCSLFDLENDNVIKKFLNKHDGYKSYSSDNWLKEINLPEECAVKTEYGLQFRPDMTGTDGFYISILQR